MRRLLLHALTATVVSALVMAAAEVIDVDTNIDTGNNAWKGLILLTWLWVFVAWIAVAVALLAGLVRRWSRGGGR